jgi:hypothetical protein
MHLMIKVVKPFGFYIDEHKVGEEFSVPLGSVEELIKEGLATIVVNNMGNNLPYDEKEIDPFEEIPVVVAEAPKRKTREMFWDKNGICTDCGGRVEYYGPINTISCDTCTNEITEWM